MKAGLTSARPGRHRIGPPLRQEAPVDRRDQGADWTAASFSPKVLQQQHDVDAFVAAMVVVAAAQQHPTQHPSSRLPHL